MSKTGASKTDSARRPLSGVRIIDLGQVILLPYATRWLAWMGAEVILIESSTRPVQRATPPFAFERRGLNTGSRFNTMNYNKVGCTLNLKTPEAIALIKRLVAMSDAVVENFSTGTMEKLGLTYEILCKENPSLIYLSASAFGRTGPWRDYAGYHSTVNAFSGLAQITGYPGGPPRLLGAVLPDTIGGTYIALALLTALYHRHRTGEGRYIDFSMLEGMVSLMPQPIMDYTLNGREWQRVGNRDAVKAPHGIYRCKGPDTWVAISVESQAEWEAFCVVTENRDWLGDTRFTDEFKRHAHYEELDSVIEKWTSRHTPDEVTRLLQEAGIATGPALDVAELLDNEHLRKRGFVVEVDHPEAGRRKAAGIPWKLGNVPEAEYRHAPLIGEHNCYVFHELLGLPESEVEELIDKGVIE